MTSKRSFRLAGFIFSVLLLGYPFTVRAAEQNLDDILSGFDDPVPTEETAAESELDDALSGFDAPAPKVEIRKKSDMGVQIPDWLAVNGGIGLASSINYAHDAPPPGRTDHRGLSRLKATADLRLDGKFSNQWQWRLSGKGFYDFAYRINGHSNYTEDVLSLYEHEAEFEEMYVRGTPNHSLDIKLGRQIVAWGKSDTIRVTDILNPLDNREPGLVDIRDLRLPIAMTKIDWFTGQWNIGAMVVHEMRFNKDPVFDNDFFPADIPPPPEERPATSLRNQEFGLAINGIFSGWDLSLYGAYVFDDQAHLEINANGPVRRHDRIRMTGAALNVAMGNWLLKGEVAYLAGLHFMATMDQEKQRLDSLIGAEYSGFTETVISFELANRHILGFTDIMSQPPDNIIQDDLQSVIRISRDFWHDTLTITGLASTFGLTGDDGAFQRLTCEYDWSDAIIITIGLINYDAGDKFAFRNIGVNDRIFLELRYSFGS